MTNLLRLFKQFYVLGFSGGGGDNGDSEEARKLYQAQADTAEFMLGLGKQRIPGAVEQYGAATNRYFDPRYMEEVAGLAGADAQQAIGQNRAATGRSLSRYGINPNSGRFAGIMADNEMRGAALQAGAMNSARQGVRDKQYGASKDYFSSLVGIPSDSARVAGSAAAGFTGLSNAAQQQSADQSAGLGMLANTGLDIYKAWNSYANGGLVSSGGAGLMPSQYDAPRMAAPQTDPMPGKLKAGVDLAKNVGKIASGTAGLEAGTAAALGETGLALGSEQAAMLAAQEAGMGALGGAGTALGAAMPWVGAAMALSKLFDFADGGAVDLNASLPMRKKVYEAMYGEPYADTPEQRMRVLQDVSQATGREDMRTGGAVDGPGTPTSDSIPAHLSDGEFVVNAEAMKIPGVPQLLEKINNAGLQRRYQ